MTIVSRVSAAVVAGSLCLTAAATAQQRDLPADLAAQIDALVTPAANAAVFSGVVLVARGGEIVYRRSFGYADWEQRVPNAWATRFGIGSLTKGMTAIVVAALEREGRLDPDAPVERYLPGFPRGPAGTAPTIAQLVTHRAGVPHRVTDERDETQPLHPVDIVERVAARGLLFEPGSQRRYSSAGYTCLARVIEIVEGKPFAVVLEERVFGPAGMRATADAPGRTLMPRRARPHHLGAHRGQLVVVRAPYKDLRFLTGAGSVYTTAEDLLRYLRAVHDGVFGATRWNEWFDADATSWVGSIGRTAGYEAFLDVLPAQDLSLIVLTNVQSAASTQVRDAVRRLLRHEPAEPIPLPPPVAAPFESAASLVGTYDNNGTPAVVRLVDGHLFRGENEFYPTANARYYIPASGSIMWFRRDAAGAVDALHWERDGAERMARRVP